jgi:hypothetical protein
LPSNPVPNQNEVNNNGIANQNEVNNNGLANQNANNNEDGVHIADNHVQTNNANDGVDHHDNINNSSNQNDRLNSTVVNGDTNINIKENNSDRNSSEHEMSVDHSVPSTSGLNVKHCDSYLDNLSYRFVQLKQLDYFLRLMDFPNWYPLKCPW